MENEEMWTILASLMPEGIEVIPDGSQAEIKQGENILKIVYNEDNNSYTINGKTLHFEDDFEVINTMLIPYILQELDGERRI